MNKNTFMQNLTKENALTRTTNGATAYNTSFDKVYDLFALGGAYRGRTVEDQILLFKNAYEENPDLAMICLFYLRDIRGGMGERAFFRNCFRWLCTQNEKDASKLLDLIPEYGRWDDLLVVAEGTPLENRALTIIEDQLVNDVTNSNPSLLAKWLPSLNASSTETKRLAAKVRDFLDLSSREYRLLLSKLRNQIKVLERTMSANEWDNIKFDQIPSNAGLKYRDCFVRRPETHDRYSEFLKGKDGQPAKVNAGVLAPYQVVHEAIKYKGSHYGSFNSSLSDPQRVSINTYWANLKDYLKDKPLNAMCVIDTSGSMTFSCDSVKPIDVAVALGIYCAERAGGPFKNHYISYSRKAKLVEVNGVDFVDKVSRIVDSNVCENTNLNSVFELLEKIAQMPSTKLSDMPETLIIISDMQIDGFNFTSYHNGFPFSVKSDIERIRLRWETLGLKFPNIVYWNVNALNNTFLEDSNLKGVSYVSGFSPVLFEQILKGKSGRDLMIDKLTEKRYLPIFERLDYDISSIRVLNTSKPETAEKEETPTETALNLLAEISKIINDALEH